MLDNQIKNSKISKIVIKKPDNIDQTTNNVPMIAKGAKGLRVIQKSCPIKYNENEIRKIK